MRTAPQGCISTLVRFPANLSGAARSDRGKRKSHPFRFYWRTTSPLPRVIEHCHSSKMPARHEGASSHRRITQGKDHPHRTMSLPLRFPKVVGDRYQKVDSVRAPSRHTAKISKFSKKLKDVCSSRLKKLKRGVAGHSFLSGAS